METLIYETKRCDNSKFPYWGSTHGKLQIPNVNSSYINKTIKYKFDFHSMYNVIKYTLTRFLETRKLQFTQLI